MPYQLIAMKQTSGSVSGETELLHLDGLEATDMPADWRATNPDTLSGNIEFMDDCLAKGNLIAHDTHPELS